MRRLFALIAALLAAPLTSLAATPDFTGVWMVQPEYYLGRYGASPTPKLTPAVLARAAKLKAAEKAGYVREVSGMLCGQNGGPTMFQIRTPFEIFSGFDRFTLIFETEMNNQPRTIYMDQKTQPDAVYPAFNGHSIGHWEGATLVVDTVGFVDRGPLLGPVPRTAQTHTTERFSLSADGKVLSNQITIEDPSSLLEPWAVTLQFDKKPNSEQRFEVWCDADLEAFKTLDLEALKDADPEIALILAGANTDPAVTIAKDAAAK